MHSCVVHVMRQIAVAVAMACVFVSAAFAQQQQKYEATIESLDKHPLPQWYADAKLGIFIHWGLYSVPGWAPLIHPEHDFTSRNSLKHNPFAEWNLNSIRLKGQPPKPSNRDHNAADSVYYNFV